MFYKNFVSRTRISFLQPISKELNLLSVRFEVFAAATIKNVVFWDVTLCDSCKNRLASIIRVRRISELRTLAVTSNRSTLRNVVSGSLILLTLMMEEIHYSKTLVLTRATRRHIPEDEIFSIYCTSLYLTGGSESKFFTM
jgi:hypothetical protein